MKPGSEAEKGHAARRAQPYPKSLNWSAGPLAYEVEVICFVGTYAHNAS